MTTSGRRVRRSKYLLQMEDRVYLEFLNLSLFVILELLHIALELLDFLFGDPLLISGSLDRELEVLDGCLTLIHLIGYL